MRLDEWRARLAGEKTRMVSPERALPGRGDPVLEGNPRHRVLGTPLKGPIPEGFETLHVGMGCFWGAERLFWRLDGVWCTAVGYGAGHTPNPTYEEVCTGLTGHAELVRVVYDPAKITLERLLATFWTGHDPTQGMRQGNDIGTQYRSGLYAMDDDGLAVLHESRARFAEALKAAGHTQPITTEIGVLRPEAFYFAEAYHQQYLAANPGGYCGLGGLGVAWPA